MYEKRQGLVFPLSSLQSMKGFSVNDIPGRLNTPSIPAPDPQSLIQAALYVWVGELGSLVRTPLDHDAFVNRHRRSAEFYSMNTPASAEQVLDDDFVII